MANSKLDEQKYETLLAERQVQLAEKKEREGSFGTALLSVAPEQREGLEGAVRGRRAGGGGDTDATDAIEVTRQPPITPTSRAGRLL